MEPKTVSRVVTSSMYFAVCWPGRIPGTAYSFHGVGLSLLLAPWLAIAPTPPAGLRLFGALCAFFLGLAVAESCRRLDANLPATAIAALGLLTAPVAFNAPRMPDDLRAR